MIRLALTATAALALCAQAARGQEAGAEVFPRIEVEVPIEVQNDLVFQSDDPGREINDLYTTTEPTLRLRLNPEFRIEAGLVLEPVLDAEPFQDRFFEDHGIYVEQFFTAYETPLFEVYGGKFNPSFGLAWDETPGIYGTNLAEDYELTERLGLGGVLVFGGEGGLGGSGFGEHRFAANLFVADTSPLSDSAITRRGELDRADGGPSNTGGLSSFSLTLDGSSLPGLEGIGYHLGARFQGGGVGDPEDESGFVGALTFERPLNERLTLQGIAEAAYFVDFEAQEGDAFYATLGSALVLDERWNLSLAYALRDLDLDEPDIAIGTDDLIQVSAGYKFESGLGIDLGYVFFEDAGVDNHGLGLLLTYNAAFSYPRAGGVERTRELGPGRAQSADTPPRETSR